MIQCKGPLRRAAMLLAFCALSACADKSATPRKIVIPCSPELARSSRVQGEVLVEYSLRADGSVGEVRVVSGSHVLFDESLIGAVREWRFLPVDLSDSRDRRVTFRLRLEKFAKAAQWSSFIPPDQLEIVARVELAGPTP